MNKTIAKMQTWSVLAACLLSANWVTAQTELWTAGANQNWSTPGNWSAGAIPNAATNVLFTNNTGAATIPGTVDSVVDSGFAGTIAALQFANYTNSGGVVFYHTLQIASGQTLTVTNGLTVGTLSDGVGGVTGTNLYVNASIAGAGATLSLTGGSLVVNQASAQTGAHLAVLNLTNLDNFTANIGRLQIGVANGVNRAEGNLFLAKTNRITFSGSAPQLYMGFNNGNNNSSVNYPILALGESNAFFVDSIAMSADKQGNPATRVFFNPVFLTNNPVAYFRGTNGSNSRVSTWTLGNNSGQSNTGSTSDCTNDYSGGTLDAMVDKLTLGVSESQTSGKTGAGNGSGTFTFTAGNLNVNTLYLGYSEGSFGASVGNGYMNVNGSGTLTANNAICLAYWTPGGLAGSYGTGVLNINGGTVLANTITNGTVSPGSSGTVSANLTINNGTLGITSLLGSVGTTAWPLGIVTLNNATLQLPISGLQTNVVASLLNLNGTTNIINITSVPASVTNYPAQFPLIAYGGGLGGSFNVGVSNLPSTYQGYISNNVNDATIDLVLTSGPTRISTLAWKGSAGANWDTTSINWLNGSSPVAYFEGAGVLFDDTATGSTNVNLTAVRSPASVTINNNTLSYSFSGAGIGGGASLTKNGSGLVLFTNSGNNFAGGITINAGTVQFGNGGTSGNLPATGNVLDNGNLIFNHSGSVTIPNLISGTGALTQNGSNVLTLTAPNDFGGTASVNNGTLLVSGILSGTLNSAAGSTIGGSGTNTGLVNVSGTIEPSAATGLYTTFTAGALTLASGALPAFGVASGSNDTLQVNGDLNVNNNNISVNFSSIPQPGTTYNLINYTGIQHGSFKPTAIGTHYTATVNQGSSPVSVTVSGAGANLEWTSTSSAVWDTGVTTNWLNQGTSLPDAFYAGDNVLFDEGVPGVVTNVTIGSGVAVVPSLVTVNATNQNFSIGGTGRISGGAAVQKYGPGTLSLNTPNDYTGDTQVYGGTLKLGANAANGNGTTYVSSGATLDLNNFASGSVSISGTGVGGNGVIINSAASLNGDQTAFDSGITVYVQADSTVGIPNRWDIRNGSLQNSGGSPHNLTIVGSSLLALVNATVDDGLGNIDVKSGTLGIQTSTLSQSPAWAGDANHILTVENGATLELDSTSTGALGQTLVFDDGSTLFNEGTICDVSGPVTLQGNVTITNNVSPTIEMDGVIAGTGGFTKTGGTSLTLTAANTYSGSTLLNAGSVILSGSGSVTGSSNIVIAANALLDASQRSDQTLTLAGGQFLQGNGSVNGLVVVGAGATISAGTNSSNPGLLISSNNVTLQGNTLMKLNPAAPANDVINVVNGGSLALGGTLTVTNVSGTPFTIGNSFQLFNAATYTGNFTTVVPATPGAGLAWNTNNLPSGSLSVVAGATPPQPGITGISLSGTSLVINGTNGVAGESYHVLTTTNLALPLPSWTVLPAGSFNAANFSITNPVIPNAPQSYYLIRVP